MEGNQSYAIGNKTAVTGNNSVAIGHGSQATTDNEFSVGGNETGNRRITHVAPGINDNDAATVGQTRQWTNQLNKKIDHYQKRANAGIANAVALGAVPQNWSYDSNFGIGVGQYEGESAFAAKLGFKPRENIAVSVGAGFDSRNNQAFSAGMSFGF